jgi:hypothetical protein
MGLRSGIAGEDRARFAAVRLESRFGQQFAEAIDKLFVPREAKMRNR